MRELEVVRYKKAVDNNQADDTIGQIQTMVQLLNNNRGGMEKARIEALLLQLKKVLEVIIGVFNLRRNMSIS